MARWPIVPRRTRASLDLAALLQADFGLCLGAFDIATGGQPLVAEYPQRFNFRALASALAVFQNLKVARSGHTVFVNGAFTLGQWAPQHQQFANVLNGGRVQRVRQSVQNFFAHGAVI